MSITCQICRGAIPDGEPRAGHTALCAGVVGEQLDIVVAEITRLREALAWYADDGNHASPGHSAEGWCRDSGQRARLALGLPSTDAAATVVKKDR